MASISESFMKRSRGLVWAPGFLHCSQKDVNKMHESSFLFTSYLCVLRFLDGSIRLCREAGLEPFFCDWPGKSGGIFQGAPSRK